MTQTFANNTSPYRSAGWAAIASGAIGILAVGSLIGYLVYRNQTYDLGILMQRFHDVGVILQFLLMITVIFGLSRLSQQLSPAISRLTLKIAVGALLFTVLCLLLIFPKIVWDGLYMFPQGIFGVCLIFINLRLKGIISKGLRWFGIVVGLGLTLVGMFIVGYAIFVSTIPFHIPAASFEEIQNIPITSANIFLHYFIDIGSLLGVLTLPFWTILIGRRLLREKI